MVTFTVVFFGRLLPKKASRITQYQFRTKIKSAFATYLTACFNRATKQGPDL